MIIRSALLTPARLAILEIVRDKPKLCNADISDVYNSTPPNTHNILRVLLRNKLVDEAHGENDSKRVLYSVTKRGREILKKSNDGKD